MCYQWMSKSPGIPLSKRWLAEIKKKKKGPKTHSSNTFEILAFCGPRKIKSTESLSVIA